MAHDEEQERHLAVKKNRLTLSKTPIFGWWRPAWNLSFEARVGILAPAVVEGSGRGDDGGVPSRGDTSLGADLRALGEEVG